MNDNQNPTKNPQNNESEKDCHESNLELIQNPKIDTSLNQPEKENQIPKDQNLNIKPPVANYYNKNLGQITIKADKDLVEEIKLIAKYEQRTIKTVTNRLLEFALNLYEEKNPNYKKEVEDEIED